MNIYSIPYIPFIEHIIPYLIPFNEYDFKTFLNYRLVSKTFNRYFTDKKITNILNSRYKLNHTESFYETRAEYWATIFKFYKNKYAHFFTPDLLDVFNGINEIYSLPVLYNVDWWVISKLYTIHNLTDENKKKLDPWNALKQRIKNPIMRGVDTAGRHFISLKYYNYTLKCYHLEILYRDNCKINNKRWSFIGEDFYTFIGGVGLENNIYRNLLYLNYDFLKYILKNKSIFVANKIDSLNHPVKSRYPLKPMHNDYWSDEDSEEEYDTDLTLNKITENTFMLSLNY